MNPLGSGTRVGVGYLRGEGIFGTGGISGKLSPGDYLLESISKPVTVESTLELTGKTSKYFITPRKS